MNGHMAHVHGCLHFLSCSSQESGFAKGLAESAGAGEYSPDPNDAALIPPLHLSNTPAGPRALKQLGEGMMPDTVDSERQPFIVAEGSYLVECFHFLRHQNIFIPHQNIFNHTSKNISIIFCKGQRPINKQVSTCEASKTILLTFLLF